MSVSLGMVAGYFPGLIDKIIMYFSEFFIGLPRLILVFLLFLAFSDDRIGLVLIFGLTGWASLSRVTRTLVLSFKERNISADLQSFVKNQVLKELSPIIAIGIAEIILFVSVLGFLGLVSPNIPSWGRMLQLSQEGMRYAWWAWLFPGLAIFFAVIAFHSIGDTLREIVSPQKRKEPKIITI